MRTLFRRLIDEQELRDPRAFLPRFAEQARLLAERDGDMRLATLEPAVSTFEAWYYGQRLPNRDARRVLMAWFGHSIERLWAQTPEAAVASRGGALDREGADLHEMRRGAAMAARRARDFALGAEQGQLGDETLGYLQDEVRRIAAALDGLRRPDGGAERPLCCETLRRCFDWCWIVAPGMDIVLRLVPDRLWEIFQDVVPEPPVRAQGGGRRRCDDRAVLAAIIFVATSGCTWRQVPPVFGASWQTVHRRFTDWSTARVWAKLHRVVLDQLGRNGELDWSRCAIDSASVRAVKGGL